MRPRSRAANTAAGFWLGVAGAATSLPRVFDITYMEFRMSRKYYGGHYPPHFVLLFVFGVLFIVDIPLMIVLVRTPDSGSVTGWGLAATAVTGEVVRRVLDSHRGPGDPAPAATPGSA